MKNIVYVTNDPERATGLERNLSNFHVICTDDSHVGRGMESEGVSIFSLEKEMDVKNPIFRNSNRLLSHPEVQDYLKQNLPDKENTYMMTFKISSAFEQTLRSLGYQSLNTDSILNKKFENKIPQYSFLKRLDLSLPKTIISKLSELDADKVTEELGNHLVVQFDRGHSGESTFFINSISEFEKFIDQAPDRVVKISEYINGDAWTVNGVIDRFGIHFGGLSYQITGDPLLTEKKGATVGNDWTLTKDLTNNEIKEVASILTKVGKQMQSEKYKGLFGIDLMINGEGVYLIEINARQPASTGIHTKYMLENDQIPLMLLHLAEFTSKNDDDFVGFINAVLGSNYDRSSLDKKLSNQNSKLGEPLQLSQFIIRNELDKEVEIEQEVLSGKYEADSLTDRSAYDITYLEKDDEDLLLTTEIGRRVSKGLEIARIQSKSSVLNSSRSIDEKYKSLITEVRDTYSDPQSKTLPSFVNEEIYHYRNLKIKNRTIKSPYYINTKRVRGGLRALVGKGTPEEIEEESLIYMKLRGFALEENSDEQVREFLSSQGIGIECSGFVCQILDYWLDASDMKNLSNYIQMPDDSFLLKIIRKQRYIENIDANRLTNDQNTRKINLREVKPGDIIRLRGAKKGYHVALISKVTYNDKKEVEAFEYVHSTPHYGNDHGVRTGRVVITDLKKELSDQKWEEVDPTANRNWTYEGLMRDYEDNGLRRLNFIEQLKW